jgi:hypothetical protein
MMDATTDLDLTAFATRETNPACPRMLTRSGLTVASWACCQAHADDLTDWCVTCFDRYVAAVRAGDDYMAGNDPATGRLVGGFHGHEPSLEVLNEALALMPPGNPTPAEMAELRAIAGDGDHDGFLGDEDRAAEALTSSDFEWAAWNLDPEGCAK